MLLSKPLMILLVMVFVCNADVEKEDSLQNLEDNQVSTICNLCHKVVSNSIIQILNKEGLNQTLNALQKSCNLHCFTVNPVYDFICIKGCDAFRKKVEMFSTQLVKINTTDDFCYAIHACTPPGSLIHVSDIYTTPPKGKIGQKFILTIDYTVNDYIGAWETVLSFYYKTMFLFDKKFIFSNTYKGEDFLSYNLLTNNTMKPGMPYRKGDYHYYYHACLGKNCSSQPKPVVLFSVNSVIILQ
jgi:hypothetical protein